MKNIFLTLLIISSFTLVSCAKKEQTKASVNIDFFSSALSDDFPGGVIIMAQNVDTNQTILRRAQESEDGFLLDNGTWRFAVIGWSGNPPNNGKFTGAPFCATQSAVELNGEDIEIDFQTDETTCMTHPLFGNETDELALGLVDTTGFHFQKIALKQCGFSTAFLLGSTVTCITPGTMYQSFQFGIKVAREDGTFGPPIFSACIEKTSSPQEMGIYIPVSANDPTEPKFHYIIKAHSNTNCTNLVKTYHLDKGLIPDLIKSPSVYPIPKYTSDDTTIIYLK